MKKTSKDKRNSINVLIGKNLQYFMESNDITTEEIAESFGIEPDSVIRIMRGVNGISAEYCHILLTEYNCDMNFLFGGISMVDELSVVQTKLEKKMPTKKCAARSLRYIAEIIEMEE